MDFVDYQLSEQEKLDADLWCDPMDPEHTPILDEIVQDGYRITFTLDTKNHCTTVTLIKRGTDGENVGRCMSTRHGTVRKALQLAVYKHVVVFGSGSWGETGAESLYG